MTIKDVSKRAGVSVATISRVMNDDAKVSGETKEKVRRAIEEMNYVPNLLGRHLRKVKTGMIYILIPAIDNPFYAAIIFSIEKTANKYGYNAAICETFNARDKYSKYIDSVRNKVVDGLIAISPKYDDAIPSDPDFPMVICGESHAGFKFFQVDIDNERAAYAATGHLLSKGRRNVAYIGGENTSGHLREKGYRRALADAGLFADDGLIGRDVSHFEHARAAAGAILASGKKVDAIFAASDILAIGAIREITARGLSVPGDIAVAGFDDLSYARMFSPALTTVHQPCEELGRTAFELLYSILDGRPAGAPETTYVPFSIIEREST
jgi:DNA-binding LacI/PurR family transcriptional regulator